MSGRLTIREATAAARSLNRFTRKQFADELGVSMIESGKWLTRLQDEREVIRRDGREYVWDPVAERPEPEAAPYEGMDLRVAARRLGTFTIKQFAQATGLGEKAARRRVQWLKEIGVISERPRKEWQKTATFDVVEIKPNKIRPREKPVEREFIERVNGGQVTHGDILRPLARDFQPLFDAIYASGGTIDATSRHYKVTMPNGSKFGMSKTPSDSRSLRNAIAEARRFGVRI